MGVIYASDTSGKIKTSLKGLLLPRARGGRNAQLTGRPICSASTPSFLPVAAAPEMSPDRIRSSGRGGGGAGARRGPEHRLWRCHPPGPTGLSRMRCICTSANAYKNASAGSPEILQRPNSAFRKIPRKTPSDREGEQEDSREN